MFGHATSASFRPHPFKSIIQNVAESTSVYTRRNYRFPFVMEEMCLKDVEVKLHAFLGLG